MNSPSLPPRRHAALTASLPAMAPAGPEEPVLEVRDIQGNILAGFNKDYQSYLFLRIGNVRKAKKWIGQTLAPRLSSTDEVLAFNRLFRAAREAHGETHVPIKATWINAGFSAPAIAKLATPADAAGFADEAFRQGLAKRSAYLGDAAGSQRRWKVGGTAETEADIVVIIASDDKTWGLIETKALTASALLAGMDLVYVQHGATLPAPWRGHEHFGFKDGISQPGIRGRVSAGPADFLTRRWIDPADARSQFFGKPGQPLLWPGEFLLGQPRHNPQTLTNTPEPAPTNAFPTWARNGSYLVVRRLRQDYGAFWAFVTKQARELGMTPHKLAAQMVGRWPSGAPVLRSPAADNAALGADDLANNHFAFNRDSSAVAVNAPGYPGDAFPQAKNDFLGQVCPHFAHIRKVNPRDGATDLGVAEDTGTRFLLRRGIPYGATLLGIRKPTPAQLKADRGLVFVSYQSSIENQFETLIRRWTNTPNLPNPGGHDPIIGQEDTHGSRQRFMDVPRGARRCFLDREFVTPTGGGYFFAPPISAVAEVLGK